MGEGEGKKERRREGEEKERRGRREGGGVAVAVCKRRERPRKFQETHEGKRPFRSGRLRCDGTILIFFCNLIIFAIGTSTFNKLGYTLTENFAGRNTFSQNENN
jgi:hypothetical protein